MNIKLAITSTEYKKRAIEIINNMPLEPVHDLIIKEHKRDRSSEQNALYWKWLTVIGNELGESKEAKHEFYKDAYLVQIYERDNPEYADMVQSLREVWKHGLKEEAVRLRKDIVSLTSITTATVHQMAEYMTEIDRHAASLGIRLPAPED